MTEKRATQECPHCFTTIDARAAVCPNCQQRIKKSSVARNLAILLIVIIGLVIIGFLASVLIIAPEIEKTQQNILDALGESSSGSSASSNSPSSNSFPSFSPINLSGRGDDIVDIDKPESPAIVEITHTGSSNFSVLNYGTNGQRIDLLVNEIGSYSGTVPIDFLVSEHTGRFEITADGSWTLHIKPLSSARKTRVPGSVSGSGDAVIALAGSSPDTAMISHTGESNFVVLSYGTSRDLLVNDIGNYSGRVILDRDTFILAVTADGSWSIDITEG